MHKHSINLDDKVNTIVLNFWVKAEPELINFTSHNVETPMIEKINQAKKQLNFNNKQLSEALGYSRQYITKMLNLPQSEKIQNKVENEIHALLSREKFNPLSILSKPSEQRLDKLKNLSNVAINAVENPIINEMSVLRFQNNCKDKDITALEKKLENNQVVINKLDDQLIRAEKVHNEDVKALQEAHSIIHIKNQRIEELERDIDGNNIEIKELNQAYIEVCDAQKWNKDRIICERWLFLIIIAILLAVVIFK